VAGLYHGDVCPRNVLIVHDGHVYLTDYGISIYNHPYGNHPDDLEVSKVEESKAYSVSVAPEMVQGNRSFDVGLISGAGGW